MGQALYRKYRSRSLAEIVGQQPVVDALGNAIKKGEISHAYLFTGPRGVGKTSVARILAHEINKIPYKDDNLPIDIIEIDAASNRRIDEIRDLREKVRIAPINAKFKVYIIDEVHMLTREAFNALLKTLEEPPEHVVFILATTEAHKLPETIISRTQRYNFKLASSQEVKELLKAIVKKESIKIDDESLGLIAEHSGGSLRDAISLLDQVRHSSGDITAELVRQNLGLPPSDLSKSLLAAVAGNNPQTIIKELREASDDGASAVLIAEQLLKDIRAGLVDDNSALGIEDAIGLIDALIAVESSTKPDIRLEIALISVQLNKRAAGQAHPKSSALEKVEPPLTISEPAKRKPAVKAEISKTEPSTDTASAPAGSLDSEAWGKTLQKIRVNHNTLYSILRIAEPDYSQIGEQQFILKFKFPFHQKRMSESQNKQIVLKTFDSMGISGYELVCELLPKEKRDEIPDFVYEGEEPVAPTPKQNNLIDQVRSVFGTAEVLE